LRILASGNLRFLCKIFEKSEERARSTLLDFGKKGT